MLGGSLARRCAACSAAVLLLTLALAAPARAQALRPRVVVLTLHGTTLADWSSPRLPAMRRILARSSLALLSTRSSTPSRDQPARTIQVAGHQSMTAGARVEPGSPRANALYERAAAAGIRSIELGADLGGALSFGDVPPSGPTRVFGPAQIDPRFPTRARTNLAALVSRARAAMGTHELVVIDFGDTARVMRMLGARPELAARWIRLAMVRADRLVRAIAAELRTDDALLIVAPSPPSARQREGLLLSNVALYSPSMSPGLLVSPTTRRDGLLALTDVAPTALRLLSAGSAGFEGRAARVVAGDRTGLRGLARDVVASARLRHPLTRLYLYGVLLLAALSLLTVLSGRGPRIRGWLAAAWLVWVSMPLAMHLTGFSPTTSTTATAAVIAGVAAVLGVAARVFLGHHRALLALSLSTAGTVLADLVSGGGLALRSPMGSQAAVGARFYGVGEELLGVVVGATLVGVAMLLDRGVRPSPAGLTAAFVVVAALLGSPSYGAKFGAALTAVPAFGVLAARALGRRLDRIAALAIAIAAVLLSGLLAFQDVLADEGARGHVGRAVQDETASLEILARKLATTARVTFTTAWTVAFGAVGGAAVLLFARRRETMERAFWGRPYLRAALLASTVGSVAALAFNDGGIVAAATIAIPAAAAGALVLLAPE